MTVNVADHRDLRIVPVHPVEEPIHVRVMEIVVEEEDGQRDVRIPVDLVAAVLANTGRIAERPGIGDTGVAAGVGDVLSLLRPADLCLFIGILV